MDETTAANEKDAPSRRGPAAQARHIFRDLLDIPADVSLTGDEVIVRLHRRAHLAILSASRLLDQPVKAPWCAGRALRITS